MSGYQGVPITIIGAVLCEDCSHGAWPVLGFETKVRDTESRHLLSRNIG